MIQDPELASDFQQAHKHHYLSVCHISPLGRQPPEHALHLSIGPHTDQARITPRHKRISFWGQKSYTQKRSRMHIQWSEFKKQEILHITNDLNVFTYNIQVSACTADSEAIEDLLIWNMWKVPICETNLCPHHNEGWHQRIDCSICLVWYTYDSISKCWDMANIASITFIHHPITLCTANGSYPFFLWNIDFPPFRRCELRPPGTTSGGHNL